MEKAGENCLHFLKENSGSALLEYGGGKGGRTWIICKDRCNWRTLRSRVLILEKDAPLTVSLQSLCDHVFGLSIVDTNNDHFCWDILIRW